MANPTIPTLLTTRLAENVTEELRIALAAKFSWLDNAYGKAQIITKEKNGNVITAPMIYAGNTKRRDYLSMLPDRHLGNYCFVVLDDPYTIDEYYSRMQNEITVGYNLIFWFNLETIYEDIEYRSIEVVKSDIMKFLIRELVLTTGSISITGISERAENIFGDFTINEQNKNYLMQPYGGLKFSGEMKFREDC